jgi:predicted RecB family nuclease
MNESIQDLLTIPGVGKSISRDLIDLGIRQVKDLKKRNPEILYNKLCAIRGRHIDRCVLYVFRCAVYFATEKQHDPHLLKWWNWKDQNNRKLDKKPRRTAATDRSS